MATEIRDASGALIGHQLEHTAQQVDDGLEAVKSKAEQTALEAETAARQAADKSIQTALEAETAARQAADTALNERVDNLPDPYGAYIVETAEGAVAHFEDGADVVPLKSCVVHIEPVQTGSGDPSPENVRPITGWTGMTVMRCGKNLYSTLIGADDFSDNTHATHSNDGGVMVIKMSSEDNSGLYSRVVSAITKLLVGKTSPITYSFDIKSTVEGDVAVGYQSAGRLVKNVGTDWQHVSITATPNGNSSTFTVYNRSGVAREVQIKNFQFELGSTATDYELYTGETYNITFPDEAGAVYGGTLDVVSGELRVDHICVDLDSIPESNWTHYTDNDMIRHRLRIDTLKISGHYLDFASSHFVKRNVAGTANEVKQVANAAWNNFNVEFILDADTSSEQWFQYLSDQKTAGTPVQLWYYIEPISYSLDPLEIHTLLGINNIWADCGNVSVEYRVDPTLAHESGGGSGGQGQKGDKGDKGDPGNDGYTPVKGTDYWTQADKEEMVQDVLAALPAWTGGSF